MDTPAITFTKVALSYGWLGNMSPFPIEYEGETWRTTEALFQALRFTDKSIRELIRSQKSPMAAKMMAKKHRKLLAIKPMPDDDLRNMIMCIKLKLKCHPGLIEDLLKTGDSIIIEDVTRRGARGSNLFWGAMQLNGKWSGENRLGKIWMEVRSAISDGTLVF